MEVGALSSAPLGGATEDNSRGSNDLHPRYAANRFFSQRQSDPVLSTGLGAPAVFNLGTVGEKSGTSRQPASLLTSYPLLTSSPPPMSPHHPLSFVACTAKCHNRGFPQPPSPYCCSLIVLDGKTHAGPRATPTGRCHDNKQGHFKSTY